MENVKKDCSLCQLNVNGLCSAVKKVPCSDFKIIPYISKDEKDSWPEYGGATAIKYNDGDPYKKKRKIY